MRKRLLRLVSNSVIAALLISCSKGQFSSEISSVATVRNNLQFGYFGSVGDQPRDTRDHVNVYFDMGFDGLQATIDSINYMQMSTILGVQRQLFDSNNRLLLDGEQRLRDYFTALKPSGVLQYVTYLYPLDEPDILNTPASEVVEAARVTRKVASEFGITQHLFVIYGASFTFPASDSFDLIAFDNYSEGIKIFTNGDYDKLKAVRKPYQKIALIPGGAGPWLQDPIPFYNVLNNDLDVQMIIAFVWFDSTLPAQGYTSGIRSNVRRPDYCRVGKLITSKAGQC